MYTAQVRSASPPQPSNLLCSCFGQLFRSKKKAHVSGFRYHVSIMEANGGTAVCLIKSAQIKRPVGNGVVEDNYQISLNYTSPAVMDRRL